MRVNVYGGDIFYDLLNYSISILLQLTKALEHVDAAVLINENSIVA